MPYHYVTRIRLLDGNLALSGNDVTVIRAGGSFRGVVDSHGATVNGYCRTGQLSLEEFRDLLRSHVHGLPQSK
jgi:hypothetical protein